MEICIFCNIIKKKIPSMIVYEDELSVAFEDIHPQAPVHTIVIPKKHIPTLLDLSDDDAKILYHLFSVANKIARDKGIANKGFRIVSNCNSYGGQTVYHIHLHLLGGRHMHWPPG